MIVRRRRIIVLSVRLSKVDSAMGHNSEVQDSISSLASFKHCDSSGIAAILWMWICTLCFIICAIIEEWQLFIPLKSLIVHMVF